MAKLNLFIALSVTLLGWGCSSISSQGQKGQSEYFLSYAKTQPDLVWNSGISHKVKIAIADYRSKKRLRNKKIYGDSVRTYDLRNKCPEDIDRELKQMDCKRTQDVLKDSTTKEPLVDSQGKTIPMIIYLCADGGVVRLKPIGDPTSHFRPQPHASKALRYPYYSTFKNFDDEIVKVDNHGNAVPKWTKDLNQTAVPTEKRQQLIESWADDAHTDLRSDCKNSSI